MCPPPPRGGSRSAFQIKSPFFINPPGSSCAPKVAETMDPNSRERGLHAYLENKTRSKHGTDGLQTKVVSLEEKFRSAHVWRHVLNLYIPEYLG